MNSSFVAALSATPTEHSDRPTDAQRWSVFWKWCVRRDAFSYRTQLAMVTPLVFLGLVCLMNHWPNQWRANQGGDVLQMLFVVASVQIILQGGSHAVERGSTAIVVLDRV